MVFYFLLAKSGVKSDYLTKSEFSLVSFDLSIFSIYTKSDAALS